ncbi:MAG: glycosyltransferase family 2 protein [Acidimicrobiales bacterium]
MTAPVPPADLPRVQISIVNHRNRDLVRRCLASLPAAGPNVEWQATVIDNASGDGSPEMLAAEFPHVAVLTNLVEYGFSTNHNRVLRSALRGRAAKYALVLNDDAELAPGALDELVAELEEDPGAGATTPLIVDGAGNWQPSRLSYPSWSSAMRFELTGRTEDPDETGWLQGCCLLLRLDAVVETGLFDEQFFLFFEDVDLSRRLTALGWRILTCCRATALHHGHASVLRPGMEEFTARQVRRSRYLYFAKHQGRSRAYVLSVICRFALVVRAVGLALRSARHRDLGRLRDAQRNLELARYAPTTPVAPTEGVVLN